MSLVKIETDRQTAFLTLIVNYRKIEPKNHYAIHNKSNLSFNDILCYFVIGCFVENLEFFNK